jgi:thiamine monophosphate synthase
MLMCCSRHDVRFILNDAIQVAARCSMTHKGSIEVPIKELKR